MITLGSVNIVPADKVSLGDLVFGLGEDLSPALCLKAPNQQGDYDKVLAYPTKDKCPIHDMECMTADFVSIGGWQIEVDYTQATKLDYLQDKFGSLVIAKDALLLVCERLDGRGGYSVLKFLDTANSSVKYSQYAFPSWKIVKKEGDKEIVLLDRTRAIKSQ